MSIGIYQSEVVTLKNLNNLFIELTSKGCNQRCKHCYIDFPQFKKEADYIDIELIKSALNDTKEENISCIYLTGAEPMTHPSFNAILRLCLKRTNVCICTNGSFINEKKARFLKKVEDETNNEIIFKISLDHYDELKNDEVRYRGAYRHAIFAIKHLVKYSFNPIIAYTNYYNLTEDEIFSNLTRVFSKNNIDISMSNIQINPWHDKNSNDFEMNQVSTCLDCQSGRMLTSTGVYSCPFLANDYRGRCGSDFTDYNKKMLLESTYCSTCKKSKNAMFSIDFSKFE